jgi:hypothetical protein
MEDLKKKTLSRNKSPLASKMLIHHPDEGPRENQRQSKQSHLWHADTTLHYCMSHVPCQHDRIHFQHKRLQARLSNCLHLVQVRLIADVGMISMLDKCGSHDRRDVGLKRQPTHPGSNIQYYHSSLCSLKIKRHTQWPPPRIRSTGPMPSTRVTMLTIVLSRLPPLW